MDEIKVTSKEGIELLNSLRDDKIASQNELQSKKELYFPKNENIEFTTPCFISKNTEFLRDKLESFGYKILSPLFDKGDNLISGYSLYFNYCAFENSDMNWFIDNVRPIDCGTNEELFLAIAALRDDSDINQYFINDVRLGSINYPESIIPKGSLMKCLVDKWNYHKSEFDSIGIPSHKASVEELIEHFK